MALIAQFDTDPVLITIKEKHHAWHTPGGAHGYPSRQFAMGTPNSGHEFFQFHKDMINEFFAWNNINHAASAADIAAWTAVPVELKGSETGWPTPWPGLDLAAAEARINSNVPPFANDDELGIHVETTIHNWIHGAVAASNTLNLPAAEKSIISGFHSVQSTYFYKIHGLVQFWWDRFLHPKSHIKEIIDHKINIKDLIDTKKQLKDAIDHKVHNKEIFDGKSRIKDIKEKDKDKDLVEGKGFVEIIDPLPRGVDVELHIKGLMARIAQLEAQVKEKKSPFIKPLSRPNVGESITKKDKK